VLNATTDLVNETIVGSGGTDQVNLVLTLGATYVLGTNIENGLVANGIGGVNISGNLLANTITGNALNNTLLGLDGNAPFDPSRYPPSPFVTTAARFQDGLTVAPETAWRPEVSTTLPAIDHR
jgi:hypothetical protein